MEKKRAQVGIEYLIVLGFAIFVIMGMLVIAFNYLESLRDNILINEVSTFADNVISASERVFYEGEPSKATIRGYLPRQVQQVEIIENSLFFTIETSSGTAKRAYFSNVPLEGQINSTGTVIKLQILATENYVSIKEV
jgi:hypothetical protein